MEKRNKQKQGWKKRETEQNMREVKNTFDRKLERQATFVEQEPILRS
jgi:hypothetical protein